jgi:hypothetical protein
VRTLDADFVLPGSNPERVGPTFCAVNWLKLGRCQRSSEKDKAPDTRP